ncbi:hypothetical protein QR680_015887 [Steinernema hermaphroditum]|uniref:Sulfotransferase domain-containing protein n=1 Tax=Steinernema hermaphroditum TaxID=289476 RepID=A0AA39H9A9_9BILA|nr:hypothetical protein QR680_015887 [Steinernema hermaphroditum]
MAFSAHYRHPLSSRLIYALLGLAAFFYFVIAYGITVVYLRPNVLIACQNDDLNIRDLLKSIYEDAYVYGKHQPNEEQDTRNETSSNLLLESKTTSMPIIDNIDLSTLPHTHEIIPPYVKLEEKMKAVHSHRLAACVIEKNMSTIITAIMCFLEDFVSFLHANRTITSERWHTRFCRGKNEYGSVDAMLEKTKTVLEDWMIFTLVRDPLERLISAFTDKCIYNKEKKESINCYGCHQDIECFVRSVYNRTLTFAHIPSNQKHPYLMEDVHTFPQNWHCSFQTRTNKMKIIKYYSEYSERDKTYVELVKVLQERGIHQDLIVYIVEQVTTGTTFHTTINSDEKKKARATILQNSDLLDMVYSMYYHDYELFGFPKTYDK